MAKPEKKAKRKRTAAKSSKPKKERLTGRERSELRAALLHELMHGAHLTSCMFDVAGRSGENLKDVFVFKENPELKASFDKASEAIEDFYQEAGRAHYRAVEEADLKRQLGEV